MDTEKRFILAVVLCVAIFFIFSSTGQRPRKPAPNPSTPPSEVDRGATTPNPDGGSSAIVPGPDALEPSDTNVPKTEFPHNDALRLARDEMTLELSTMGAAVTRAVLADYKEGDFETPLTVFGPDLEAGGAFLVTLERPDTARLDKVDWKVDTVAADKVVFSYPVGDGEIKKTISLPKDQPYLVDVKIEATTGVGDYLLLGPKRLRFDEGSRQSNQRVTGYGAAGFDSVERAAVGLMPGGRWFDPRADVFWSGIESNYFACVIRPLEVANRRHLAIGTDDPAVESAAGAKNEQGLQGYPYRVGFAVSAPAATTHRYEVFLGPKDPGVLSAYEDRGYPELVFYGDYLGLLVRLFLGLLHFFHGLIGSWGIAIVCLTFVVKLLLHPINKRNQGMMQRQSIRMKELQPKMDKLKEQHKNDPTRATREIQQLMKEENVNPLALFGGCLLIFLQLPIWIGLINTFTTAIELRQQSFLYIDDLTQADHLFALGVSLPLLGEYFNLLPILYVVLTLVNQKMMPKATDPQMQSQQKMMTFMMVAFGFIFYNFSSGLLVYFITSAALGIVEQRIIRAELRREGVVTT